MGRVHDTLPQPAFQLLEGTRSSPECFRTQILSYLKLCLPSHVWWENLVCDTGLSPRLLTYTINRLSLCSRRSILPFSLVRDPKDFL